MERDRGDGQLSLDGPRLRAVRVSSADAPRVQACLEGAPDYFTRVEGHPPRPDAARRLLADAEADEQRRVYLLVPRSGGPAAGVLDLLLDHPEPGVCHLVLLLFREPCQGLGYGRETVGALERALATRGCAALRLSVIDETPEARAFWERMGFAVAGRLDRGVTVFEKDLAGAARSGALRSRR